MPAIELVWAGGAELKQQRERPWVPPVGTKRAPDLTSGALFEEQRFDARAQIDLAVQTAVGKVSRSVASVV
jgi:hypothetical protein